MKFFKRSSNCIFVEDEHYNWAKPKSLTRRTIFIAVFVVCLMILFYTIK